MARGHESEYLVEGDNLPNSSATLAQYARQPSNRPRSGNRHFRPLEHSDLPEDDDNTYDEPHTDSSPPGVYGGTHICQAVTNSSAEMNLLNGYTVSDYGSLLSGVRPSMNMSPFAERITVASSLGNSYNMSNENSTQSTMHIIARYSELFNGRLVNSYPEGQRAGSFEGEIAFYLHPNLDLSAYQWSQRASRWDNIGLYSHKEGMIKGLLSSIHLPDSPFRRDSVEYFKAIAEQKERAQRSITTPPNLRNAGSPGVLAERPYSTPPQASASQGVAFRTNYQPLAPTKSATEDKYFFGPSSSAYTRICRTSHASTPENDVGRGGSRNSGFQFPDHTAVANASLLDPGYPQSDAIDGYRHPHSNSSNNPQPSYDMTSIADGVEENTMLSQLRSVTAELPQFLRGDGQSTEPGTATVEQAFRQVPLACEAQGSHSPPSSNPGMDRGSPRGRIVAKPSESVSALRADAEPYAYNRTASGSTKLGICEPDAAPLLCFLHPKHEIVNVTGDRGLTPQNFEGPFFTGCMPTMQNPATHLSSPSDERRKLQQCYTNRPCLDLQQDISNAYMDEATKPRGKYERADVANTPLFRKLLHKGLANSICDQQECVGHEIGEDLDQVAGEMG
ncbi:uncharacterized protein EI97DRAFT_471004 [Westerdykella ornata]|uniref:Uncharacterized protein n=1 Tax=Westerdykella ornata TaxID=318751 RepID=A0A6A6J5I1_WESOR|nr:uncharacterized protein EI97DRAFT_471004 [Westerdykella ornata]KAF2271652.1 hypothetical protein EI97DRAFT_471004 [Westerdykella ornata]